MFSDTETTENEMVREDVLSEDHCRREDADDEEVYSYHSSVEVSTCHEKQLITVYILKQTISMYRHVIFIFKSNINSYFCSFSYVPSTPCHPAFLYTPIVNEGVYSV